MFAAAVEDPGRPRSLLIAADDPLILEALAGWFTSSGDAVRTTGSATGVLRSMRISPPDLLILNNGPEFDNGILDRQLRTDPRTKNIPVMIVAAPHSLERLEKKPDEAHFVAKPVRLDELEARVAILLRIAT